MRISVNLDRCTGHGRCYTLAPEVFQPDDEGYCVIASADVSVAFADKALLGARNCPEEAITVDEDQGEEGAG